MEAINLVQEFPYKLADVLAARERRYEDIKRFPELKDQKILEKREEGDMIFTRRELAFGDKVPDLLKKIVPPEMLKMLEESHFNSKTHVNNYEVFPQNNKDKLCIHGRSVYEDLGEKSRRSYELKIECNVPLIGSILAGQIRDQYQKGLVKDYNLLLELLSE